MRWMRFGLRFQTHRLNTSDQDITLFKNGGGAHLDLMTARFILDRWNAG